MTEVPGGFGSFSWGLTLFEPICQSVNILKKGMKR